MTEHISQMNFSRDFMFTKDIDYCHVKLRSKFATIDNLLLRFTTNVDDICPPQRMLDVLIGLQIYYRILLVKFQYLLINR